MLRQKMRKKTRKIAQFINLLVIEPGRPGADFFCIVIPQPQPFADRQAALLWSEDILVQLFRMAV